MMDVTVSKAELNRALSLIQNMVARRTTMPILVNVLLTAADNQLKISATDLEITGVVSADAKVKTSGSTTVSAKVFSDIVRELPESDVNIKLSEGERIEIKAQQSKIRVIGVSAEEYPALPGLAVKAQAKTNARQLSEMINKTIYAVSVDETRFNLNGVCFDLVPGAAKGKKSGKSLRLVATDGHRLAMVTRTIGDLDFEGSVIVPRKGLAEIRKILDEQGEQEVGVGIHDGFLLVETQRAKVAVRLIDGEFPNYDQVIPKEKGTIASINSDELARALRRVVLLVTDKSKCVKLDFEPGSLRISSSSPELGDAREDLKIEYQGKPLSVGFNALYLLDIVASYAESQVFNIELNGELGPGKFFASSDESYLSIVMPMRLEPITSMAANE